MTEPGTTPEPEVTEPQPITDEALAAKEKGAVTEEVTVEGTPKPEEDKKYSQADFDKHDEELMKRISGLDTKLTKTSESSKSEISRLETALEEANQRTLSAQDNAYLRKVEEEGGDVNAAKETIERQKAVRVKEQEQAKKQRELDTLDAVLSEAGKAKKASELLTEHGLGADVLDELLGCENPTEMENKALKMKLAKGVIDAKPVDQVDSHDKGGKVDITKMPIEERLEQAMDGRI